MINSSLSCRCKEIILGSLLGDGSLRIQKGYKHARFSFRHSLKYKDYFYWKVEQLKEISGEKSVFLQSDKNGCGKDKLRYQSLALPSLTELYNLTHKRNILRVRRKWLNQLSPLSLCIWWLDDGSLVSDCRQGVFCTDNFAYEELLTIVRYFRKVWNIRVRIGRVAKQGKRSGQYRLWIRSTEELKKFLRIILPHVQVQSMLYKVLILYNDPNLQERWISEVCEKTGFQRNILEDCVNERKQKLRFYTKLRTSP